MYLGFIKRSCQYSDLATGWTTKFRFPAEAGNFFLFGTASTQAVGPTQLPIQCTVGSYAGGKAAGA